MLELKFKTVMYCNQYVDMNLLEKGIYITSKPYIYSNTETIETLIESGRMMKDMTGQMFISEKYFDNLKMCEMIEIEIIIKGDGFKN